MTLLLRYLHIKGYFRIFRPKLLTLLGLTRGRGLSPPDSFHWTSSKPWEYIRVLQVSKTSLSCLAAILSCNRKFSGQDIRENPVLIYMKGFPESPMCGFSALAVKVFQQYGKLALVSWLPFFFESVNNQWCFLSFKLYLVHCRCPYLW